MVRGPVVLVIDDELQIRRMLRLSLESHGYEIIEATSAEEGIQLTASKHPDIIILDLGLPDKDGFLVLKELREWCNTPVIVLSVKSSDEDKISLLDAGANDYITKPFSMGELLARMRVALRNIVPDATEGIFKTGDLLIDFAHRSVKLHGKRLKFTPTEYALLRFLARNAEKVLTHNQIINELWGPEIEPDPSYLRVYILQLRRKIEKDPSHPDILLTEPGVGYRLSLIS
ncbi:MAG: response regulator transcription factor [Spirochaetales bacterium]|nr:response regulator transcription factor [Spirochaetales bacterium]